MSEQHKVRTDFNDVTGNTIVTKYNTTKQFSDNWDAIFNKKEETNVESNCETSSEQAK